MTGCGASHSMNETKSHPKDLLTEKDLIFYQVAGFAHFLAQLESLSVVPFIYLFI